MLSHPKTCCLQASPLLNYGAHGRLQSSRISRLSQSASRSSMTTVFQPVVDQHSHSTLTARAGRIQEVDGESLEVEIMNRDRPLIVDFFATWCGPCLLLAKELEQVSEHFGDRVKILKVDCDKNNEISTALQIMGLPTLIFVGMDPSKPALRTEGLLPAQTIIEIVTNELMEVTEKAEQ